MVIQTPCLPSLVSHKRWLSLLVGCLLATSGQAQSGMFSQYYFSPLNVNPAWVGSQPHLEASVQHRSQWRNLENPFRSSLLSLTKPVAVPGFPQHQLGGVSLAVVNESAGAARLYRATGVQLGAAYNLALSHPRTHRLSFGLQGGYTWRRIDTDQLRWGSQYDPIAGYNPELAPSVGELNDRVGFASFRAGLIYYYNPARALLLRRLSGFAGISVGPLNRPQTAFNPSDRSRDPRVLRAHGGLEIPLSVSVRLLPQVLLAYQNAEQYHLNVGTYLHYSFVHTPADYDEQLRLMVGAWYRYEDAWVASAGLSYGRYRLATSYDFNTQPVAVGAFRGGAFEVSLAYRWLKKVRFRHHATPMI